jgi:hypothetical protein
MDTPAQPHPTNARQLFPHRLEYAAIFLLAILLRLPFIPATVDDAFITFRYVRNIITGQGFTFNPGEYILGTTTPLYTLYLSLWGSFGLDFITVGKLTNIAADGISCILLFTLLYRTTNRAVALIAALLIISSPYNLQYSASGMETGIYTCFILLLFFLYEKKRWGWMALNGGMLILVRPDGLLAFMIVALFWLSDRHSFKTGVKYALLTGLIMLPWFLFATWYFGSPIPHSVSAKSLTYRSSIPLHWLQILWQTFAQRGGTGGVLLITSLLGTGAAATLLRNQYRSLRPYLAWLALYIGTFTFFQSGRFGWYYAPIMPLLFAFVVLGGYEWFRQLLRLPVMITIWQSYLRNILTAALGISLITAVTISVYGAWQVANREVAQERLMWRPIGLWIQNNSSSEATIAIESIGGVGWFAERYIWDEGGLVSAKTYALNQETPGNINVLGLLQTYRPDFYIAWDPWELENRLGSLEAQTWFDANYLFVNQYRAAGKTWTMFRLREDAN